MVDRIYSDVILDHVRTPRHKGTLDPADYSYEDVSPLCGDEIRIDVRVKDDRVAAIAFSGRGCAVSQASASLLTELVAGMLLAEVKALTTADVLAEIGIVVGPARLPCALLSLDVLKTGLFGGGHDEP
jgi:nitrogen fixation NifU-like protein